MNLRSKNLYIPEVWSNVQRQEEKLKLNSSTIGTNVKIRAFQNVNNQNIIKDFPC